MQRPAGGGACTVGLNSVYTWAGARRPGDLFFVRRGRRGRTRPAARTIRTGDDGCRLPKVATRSVDLVWGGGVHGGRGSHRARAAGRSGAARLHPRNRHGGLGSRSAIARWRRARATSARHDRAMRARAATSAEASMHLCVCVTY